jgi:GntR family transcriptional regulator
MDTIKPIHMIIRDYLLSNIQSGEYQPGSQLPTENELTKKFQTSKSPVRQALDTLRIQGVIYRHPGRGTFVSPNPGGSDAWTLTSIRDIIEQGFQTHFQLHDFTSGRTSEELDRIFRVKKGKFTRIRGVRLLKDQPLYFLNVFLPQKIGRKLRVIDIADCPVIVALEKKLNIRLKKCIQNISATLADAPLARILKVPNQSPLLSIERFYFTDNEETIEWASSFCRPDLYKYRSVLSRG